MNYKLFLIVIAACTGCVSSVPQLEADVSLVEQSFISPVNFVPQALNSKLEQAPSVLDIGGKTMEVGQQYYSASGKKCHHLTLKLHQKDQGDSIVVCKSKQDEGWHYAEKLL